MATKRLKNRPAKAGNNTTRAGLNRTAAQKAGDRKRRKK